MHRLIFCICLLCLPTRGGTYYVATNGSNANPGNEAEPWRNVWYAANHVSAGDMVQVGPGEFNEFVTNTVSGTAGSPITFNGTRSGTNWLTIIDPATPLTNSWSAATEIGSGVWKMTTPIVVRELYIDHKRVAYVHTTNLLGSYACFGHTPALTNGLNYLLLPAGEDVTMAHYGTNIAVDFWAPVKALWWSTNTTLYFRQEDGSDPSALHFSGVPNHSTSFSAFAYNGTVKMVGVSNIIWQNFHMRCGFAQFKIEDGARDITIRSNLLTCGCHRIHVYDDVTRLTIAENTMTTDFYGYQDMGAWEWSGWVPTGRAKYSDLVYQLQKYIMGQNSQVGDDMRFYVCGPSNVITGNYCYRGMMNSISLETETGFPANDDTVIATNIFYGYPSTGVVLDTRCPGTAIFDNRFLDCNAQIRWMRFELAPDDTTYTWIYRNRFWLPNDGGEQLYFHFQGGYTPAPHFAKVYFYQNSCSGGRDFLGMSSLEAVPAGGLAGCYFLNNIMSGQSFWINFGNGFTTNASYVAKWDYNVQANCGSVYTNASWYGTSNVVQPAAEWANTEDMNFALLEGSVAIDAGEDLPTDYPDLPQDRTSKVGSGWDIGWNEWDPVADPILEVTPTSHGYGPILTNTFVDFGFGVTNTGTGMLNGTASTTTPFSIMEGSSYGLGGGQGQLVVVRYAPTAAGSFTQYLTLTGGNGANVLLSGQATNAPAIHSFGTLRVGSLRSR